MLRQLSSLQIYADHPLHAAAHNADVEKVKALLVTHGSHLNEVDGGGCTPLRRVIYRGTYYNATTAPSKHRENTLACLQLILDCPSLDMYSGKQVKWAIRSLFNDKYTHGYVLVSEMLEMLLNHPRVDMLTMFCPTLLPIIFYNNRADFDEITSRPDFNWNLRTEAGQSPLSIGLFNNNRSVIKGRCTYTLEVLKRVPYTLEMNTSQGTIGDQPASPLTIAVHFHENHRIVNANDKKDIDAHVKVVKALLGHECVDIHTLVGHEGFVPVELNSDDYL